MEGTANIGVGTKKLYYEDAYCAAFTAAVISCEELPGEDGTRYAVVLDQTAFFPEEGGQCPDRGILYDVGDGETAGYADNDQQMNKEAVVSDVRIRDGVITHITDRPFREGGTVAGALDFSYRFSNMQQHSAEHLFSGLVKERFGYENVGFHLSDREVTMDYNGVLTDEDIAELERGVNEAIWQDLESRQLFPSKEELDSLDYRSKIDIDGQVRLVEFPGIDLCACCAPHVARTGEIGIAKIVKAQNYKGGTRLSMLAGNRALAFLQGQQAMLGKTARYLSSADEEVYDRVVALKEEAVRMRMSLGTMGRDMLEMQILALPETKKMVCLFTEGLDGKVLCEVAGDAALARSGICGIFCGNDTDGYTYAVGAAGDVGAIQKILAAELGAKGGGKPPVVQGRVTATAKEIRSLWERMDVV